MYELNRARLVGIGPRGARYGDVTLDLSGLGEAIPARNLLDGESRRPSLYSLLLLENGGGKSVLLKLIFSVVLPGRRSTVGGAVLEKFVLDADTGHVALEWMHVLTGELLVTGKVYQRRTKTASNSNALSEAWYSFRPSELLQLGTLPVSRDGRRRRLEGFRETIEEVNRATPATQLAWIGDEQGRWRKHLRDQGIEPDLFDIQRRMNVDEGEAAKAFKYNSSKDFVNWLLTTITDPEDASSVADTFRQWATNLADRQDMLLERDFLEGAIAGLDPVADAHQADLDAARESELAVADGRRLAAALEARLRIEELSAANVRAEQDEARALGTTREGERDGARELLNEVKRRTLLLELAEEQNQKAATEAELQEVALELSGWETLPLVAERELAISTAKELAEQVAASDKDAAPALERRDLTAGRLLTKYDEEARIADGAAQDHGEQAAEAGEQADAAEGQRGAALSLAAGAQERHRAQKQLIGEAIARVEKAADSDLVPPHTRLADVPGIVLEAAESHRQAMIGVSTDKRQAADLSVLIDSLEPRVSEAEQRALQASSFADAKVRDLEAMYKAAAHAYALPALAAAIGTDDIPVEAASDAMIAKLLESAAEHLIEVLGSDTSAHTGALDDLRAEQREDARIVEALGDGGLLPARADVQLVLAVLDEAGVAAHAGWRYLRETASAEERAELIAAHPALADGVVVVDQSQMSVASDALAAAKLMPAAAIEVGTGSALLALPTSDEDESPAGFVVEPTPAMYDEDAAAHRRDELHEALLRRARAMSELENQLQEATVARNAVVQWRRDNPAGRLGHLQDEVRISAESAAQEHTAADELAEELTSLRGRHTAAVSTFERSQETERKLSDRLHALEALAEYTNAAVQAETELAALASEVARYEREADKARRRGIQSRSLATAQLKLAEQSRARAGRHRSAAEGVISTSGERSVEVPTAPLATLKDEATAAQQTYLAIATDPDLRRQAADAAAKVSQLDSELALRDQRYIAKAAELRETPAGADRTSWAVAADNARHRRDRLQGQLSEATLRTGRLEESVKSASPTEPGRRSWTTLSPEWVPTTVATGEVLQLKAQEKLRIAQASVEEINGRMTRLADRLRHADRATQAIKEAVLPLATLLGEVDDSAPAVDPYAESPESAAAAAGEAVLRLRSTRQEAEARRRELADAVQELISFASLARYETLANQARRSILESPSIRLAAQASDWSASLIARLATLTSDLENVNRHRKAIVERLAALVDHALRALRQAGRLSKLPADLAEWSGRPFLRIAFAEPDPAAVSVHVGEVVDRVAAEFAARGSGARASSKRDGTSLLLEAVHAAVPKGFTVDVLKPDSVLRDERVSIEDMNDVFSGGQELTAAIVLYCTLAALRANERGQMRSRHSGVLFLDNPIGRANASYLLDLQQSVAKALGVQLIYTTGITDDRVLADFPLWIRLRNDADLRAGLKYIQVAEVVRRVLPPPYDEDELPSDDESAPGTVTAGRVYRRPGAPTSGLADPR
ncbi:hypothetical protein FB561_5691 [Kribbella amoyensis]|uniref:Chromosome segregation ATPase n=1 Tax=Kribbella amoyensis TaxID=996641 RepID=A0A561C071_9ACTN|nr:hypothetical protein [Kribbella amoyensis]TWD84500.1 hypothetical protein FB561_5691 [Kribbella amoyensis]